GRAASAGQPGLSHVVDQEPATTAIGEWAVPGDMFGQVDDRLAGRRQQALLLAWQVNGPLRAHRRGACASSSGTSRILGVAASEPATRQPIAATTARAEPSVSQSGGPWRRSGPEPMLCSTAIGQAA